jgi:hypothetical protein
MTLDVCVALPHKKTRIRTPVLENIRIASSRDRSEKPFLLCLLESKKACSG